MSAEDFDEQRFNPARRRSKPRMSGCGCGGGCGQSPAGSRSGSPQSPHRGFGGGGGGGSGGDGGGGMAKRESTTTEPHLALQALANAELMAECLDEPTYLPTAMAPLGRSDR